MQTINKIIRSSQNSEKVSLTIKSIVAFAILVGFDSAVVNTAGGEITNFIMGLGILFSSATALYGLVRKLVLGRWS